MRIDLTSLLLALHNFMCLLCADVYFYTTDYLLLCLLHVRYRPGHVFLLMFIQFL